MNLDNRADRLKLLRNGIAGFAVSLTAGFWAATQSVASDCRYSPLLGGNLELFGWHIYMPYKYLSWKNNDAIANAIPDILSSAMTWPIIFGAIPFILLILYIKKNSRMTSHGTAAFATASEMEKSILGKYDGKNKKSCGVVCGRNPYTHELMLDYSPTHILVSAPTRSGKGVGPVLSTGITWRDSIFFFDPKGEIWQHTAGYRKKVLKQKVIKFQPLCADGSGARWNALAEIDFRTPTETKDLDIIIEMLANPTGEAEKDGAFWHQSNKSVFKGVILHLLYKNYLEGKPIPTISDVISFLVSPGKTIKERFEELVTFPHITVEEYMQQPNVFEINYPKDYILDFNAFEESLGFILSKGNKVHESEVIIKSQKDLKKFILMAYEDENLRPMLDFSIAPYNMLLTHPTVSQCATDIINTADSEQTLASIMKGAVGCISLYQNPLIQDNTSASDFRIKDLMNPDQAMSAYFIMEPQDIDLLRPLSRLFVNTLLGKLQRGMDARVKNKQRLLLLLDEFPRLGKMPEVEGALAICAGYGIKICLIVQNLGQINKLYTKDNEILSNCNTQVYFAPKEIDTAEFLSKTLGEKTIKGTSHSDGGGLFKGSNTISEQSRKLMTPDEILRLPEDKSLILIGGQPPFLTDKVFYYKIPFLRDRLDDWKTDNPKYPLIEISDYGTVLDGYDALLEANKAFLAELIVKRQQNAAKKKQKLNRADNNEEEIPAKQYEETAASPETKPTKETPGIIAFESRAKGTKQIKASKDALAFNDSIDDLTPAVSAAEEESAVKRVIFGDDYIDDETRKQIIMDDLFGEDDTDEY